jgi:hydrogenase expression/formation protein HypE
MTDKQGKILLNHGSGGKMTHELIENLFIRSFNNESLNARSDAAILKINDQYFAFTTDSYVIDPLIFPGGDIGKLAVCGTVNDLSVSGANPLYISASFIIEEGFPMELLERIVSSMASEAKVAGVKIVTGDTKVVDKGKCDKLFINTAGIGSVVKGYENIHKGTDIIPGDHIIINGYIGDHEASIISARNLLPLKSAIISDCCCLNQVIRKLLETNLKIKFMRDATRGGLGTVLNEVVNNKPFGIEIDESAIPVREQVNAICEILGFDPLYMANEGKFVLIVDPDDSEQAIRIINNATTDKSASLIGKITGTSQGRVLLNTGIGGKRIIDIPVGEQLPRIC